MAGLCDKLGFRSHWFMINTLKIDADIGREVAISIVNKSYVGLRFNICLKM